MKRYKLINDTLGWACFLIAAVTYMLTLEPTASFWDCPEFITQGYKLEIGHPPGNPIFMLTARFFINFVGGDITKVALAVNAMSGLLSAATILLLFWTITHLVKRLIVADNAKEVNNVQMLLIFGSGICGALMYAWSDTFWFSAVEGEVYAFSSFCTALVFWLILKWESRADQPHSDRYLVLIAYVLGISIGVHLLNLLCIPAIVLVFYYRKWRNTTAVGSLIALGVSFVIVALVLYGLVPGFVKMAQYFELFFVNSLGLGYNGGVLIYAAAVVAIFLWAIVELYRQRSPKAIRLSFALSVIISGIPLMFGPTWLVVLAIIAIVVGMFVWKRPSVRVLTVAALSLLVIFIGYSSYALLLVRSNAATPMNQNAPDNVFALSSYLNREQYGDRPLFYGQTPNSQVTYEMTPGGSYQVRQDKGEALYSKVAKSDPSQPDEYIHTGDKRRYVMAPELDMLFPRIYSSAPEHKKAYQEWVGMKGVQVPFVQVYDQDGNPIPSTTSYATKPTMAESLQFFFTYQLNHMYWRYFMWNFAGRQNDIQGNGEVNHGNWISGIPFIDNPRLGDQDLLPYADGEGNKGHNVFFMLPLIMGIIGLLWQAFVSKRGIEQFWVVFFLFFMTGIAIVIYLNQTPLQPRERDYAFAGSFYAFAIWVGMGVAGLWGAVRHLTRRKVKAPAQPKEGFSFDAEEDPDAEAWNVSTSRRSLAAAAVAAVIGVIVPLQVVSQTWDDHDRSGRYTTRDFGINYLNSLDDNAIIFTNGDNDTFPLWYAQEVEGERTDVKVVNLSYLTTEWYANQIRRPSYDSPAIPMLAKPQDYAYDRMQYSYIMPEDSASRVHLRESLTDLYKPGNYNASYGAHIMRYPRVYLPLDLEAMVKAGRITPAEAQAADDTLEMDFSAQNGLALNSVLSLDMLYSVADRGWNRPIYFAMTVPESFYLGLQGNMRNTGLAYEIGALRSADGRPATNTDKMYANITEKFRWGGLDQPGAEKLYLDETVRRMVSTHRTAMIDLSSALLNEALDAVRLEVDSNATSEEILAKIAEVPYAVDRLAKAKNILDLMEDKLPEPVSPYSTRMGLEIAELYFHIADLANDVDAKAKAQAILARELNYAARSMRYYSSLSPAKFATLQDMDKYVYYYYIPDLISTYVRYGGDYNKLESDWVAKGVSVNALRKLLQSMQQQG